MFETGIKCKERKIEKQNIIHTNCQIGGDYCYFYHSFIVIDRKYTNEHILLWYNEDRMKLSISQIYYDNVNYTISILCYLSLQIYNKGT